MIPEPPPELNGMEVAAWDSGYERGRREALEDAIVMLRPLRKFAVSVMTVEEKAAAFDELCAASAPPALAAEHPWIGSMSDAPQPDEPDEHDLERMDADAFTRAAASVPKEQP